MLESTTSEASIEGDDPHAGTPDGSPGGYPRSGWEATRAPSIEDKADQWATDKKRADRKCLPFKACNYGSYDLAFNACETFRGLLLALHVSFAEDRHPVGFGGAASVYI